MRRLLEEENKEMPDDNLMLHLRQDVRDNMKAVSELSAGPAIISQLDSKICELQDKVAQKELMQPEYNVLSSRQPVDEIYLRKSPNASDNFYDTKNPPGLNIQYGRGPVVDNPKLKVEVIATFGSSKAAIVTTELMNEDQLIR